MGFLHDEYEGKPMTTETPAADIVEQDHLRDQLTGRADFLRDKGEQKTLILLYQAADEFTRLRAENAELRAEVRRQKVRADDHWHNVTDLAARVAKLRRKLDEAVDLLSVSEFWQDAALNCKSWSWDADQYEAATETRDDIRAFLTSIRGEA